MSETLSLPIPVVIKTPKRIKSELWGLVLGYIIQFFIATWWLMLLVGYIHGFTALPALGYVQVGAIILAVSSVLKLGRRDLFNFWLKV